MSSGFDSAAVAPGTHFSQWDVASRRRYNASQNAPRPSWDVPAEGLPHPASQPAASAAPAAAGGFSVPYGPQVQAAQPGVGPEAGVAQAYRGAAMQDADARAAGARLTAQDASPNDPALASYAQLEGQLGGQSQASHDVNAFNASLLHEQLQQEYARQMAAYQQQLAEEYQRSAHANDWMGELGSVIGGVGGSWLSPGGLFKGMG